MKVDETISKMNRESLHQAERWVHMRGELVDAIKAKMKAADELAAVIDEIFAKTHKGNLELVLGPSLELRLGNRLHDYRVAGTEEAKG